MGHVTKRRSPDDKAFVSNCNRIRNHRLRCGLPLYYPFKDTEVTTMRKFYKADVAVWVHRWWCCFWLSLSLRFSITKYGTKPVHFCLNFFPGSATYFKRDVSWFVVFQVRLISKRCRSHLDRLTFCLASGSDSQTSVDTAACHVTRSAAAALGRLHALLGWPHGDWGCCLHADFQDLSVISTACMIFDHIILLCLSLHWDNKDHIPRELLYYIAYDGL